jgi:hypothetical protein
LLQCNENSAGSVNIGFDAFAGKGKWYKYQTLGTPSDAFASPPEFANFQSCSDHAGLGCRTCGRDWVDFGHFSVFLNRQKAQYL